MKHPIAGAFYLPEKVTIQNSSLRVAYHKKKSPEQRSSGEYCIIK